MQPVNAGNVDNASSIGSDNSRAQRELIAQLESKNKEIMREIARLRRQQEVEQITPENPALINELRALRQRKGELEGHLGALQDSRRQLMEQLEGLMRMLKNQQTTSPRSTPNSSPRSGKSPPMPGGMGVVNAIGGGANSLNIAAMHSQQGQASAHSLIGIAGAGGGGGGGGRPTQQQLLQAQQTGALQGSQQQQPFNTSQLEQLNQISNEVRSAFAGNTSSSKCIHYNHNEIVSDKICFYAITHVKF